MEGAVGQTVAASGKSVDRARVNGGTGEGVRIGGAWKLAAERQATLEMSLRIQGDELGSLRLVLERSETGRQNALKELADEKKKYALALLRGNVVSISAARARESAVASSVLAAQATRERDFHERRASVSQQLAIDTDRRLNEERERSAMLTQRLAATEKECEEFQRQYDAMEAKAERAEAVAKERTAQAELMRKAKEQKESYFGVLVKERDRVRQELVELKSQISKGRVRLLAKKSQYSATTNNGENCHPNGDSLNAFEKKAEEEKVKLEGFAAPSRIKSQLAKEIALRKQAELQVAKLESDNNALRIRIRNSQRRW